MTANGSTIVEVGRKKKIPGAEEAAPQPPPADEGPITPNRPGYPVFGRVRDEIGQALEAYMKATRPKPHLKAILETALEDFLIAKGFPPTPEK